MQRLYFLTPDPRTTGDIAGELSEMGLRRNQVHVAANDKGQLDDMGLKEATLVQTSDTLNAGKRGLLIGVPLGLVIGIIVSTVLALPSQFGNFALIVGLGIFGGLFGIWASMMIGVSVPDAKIKKYQHALQHGAFLMMVDVPSQKEEEVTEIIHRHHPEVKIEKITREERRHAEGRGN